MNNSEVKAVEPPACQRRTLLFAGLAVLGALSMVAAPFAIIWRMIATNTFNGPVLGILMVAALLIFVVLTCIAQVQWSRFSREALATWRLRRKLRAAGFRTLSDVIDDGYEPARKDHVQPISNRDVESPHITTTAGAIAEGSRSERCER